MAGIVEAIGDEAPGNASISVGDKVVVYPFEGVPHGWVLSIWGSLTYSDNRKVENVCLI